MIWLYTVYTHGCWIRSHSLTTAIYNHCWFHGDQWPYRTRTRWANGFVSHGLPEAACCLLLCCMLFMSMCCYYLFGICCPLLLFITLCCSLLCVVHYYLLFITMCCSFLCVHYSVLLLCVCVWVLSSQLGGLDRFGKWWVGSQYFSQEWNGTFIDSPSSGTPLLGTC